MSLEMSRTDTTVCITKFLLRFSCHPSVQNAKPLSTYNFHRILVENLTVFYQFNLKKKKSIKNLSGLLKIKINNTINDSFFQVLERWHVNLLAISLSRK